MATILWPILSFVSCTAGGLGVYKKFQLLHGGDWQHRVTRAVWSKAEVANAAGEVGLGYAYLVGFFYIVILFGLLVWWFATKPD